MAKLMRRLLSLLLALLTLASLLLFSSCGLLEGFSFPTLPPSLNPEALLSELLAKREEEAELRPVVPEEQLPSAFSEKYRNQLGQNEQAIYDALLAAKPGEKIEVPLPLPYFIPCDKNGEADPVEKEKATDALGLALSGGMIALWLDDPTFFWMDLSVAGGSYEMSIRETEAGNQEIHTLRFAAGVKSLYADDPQGHIATLLSEAQKVRIQGYRTIDKVHAIDTYLKKTATYDLDAPRAHEALGVFLDGKAVCEGYARAFQLLCQVNGISSAVIVGDGITEDGTEGHMWNAVLLDDGYYYGVDSTWNDSTRSNEYLLCGANTLCFGTPFSESHIPYRQISQGAREFEVPALVILEEKK